jgi:hypothetical protein
MKTSLFSTLICTFFFTTALALNPPLSSRGFQSVFLGSTSQNFSYANRSITATNDDLRIILMGNQGINTNIWAEFGWNDQTGELAQKQLISDGIHINPPELEYDWIPLEFRVANDGNGGPTTLPTSGIGVPIFPGRASGGGIPSRNDVIIGPTIKPMLVASPNEKIGMVGADGNFVSKWYACDGASWGSALSWSFDETAAEDPLCVSLSVFKVNNPRG